MIQNNNNERSSLWGASAWSALIGGTGYGLYKSTSELKTAFLRGNEDITGQTVAHLKNLGRFDLNTRLATSMPNVDSFLLDRLNATGGGRVQADIANATYNSILAGGQISGKQAFGIRSSILNQSSVNSAYEEASKAIASNNGVASIFNSNLERLGQGGFYNKERMAEFASSTFISDSHLKDLTNAKQSMSLSTLRGKFGEDVYNNAVSFNERLDIATGGKLKFNKFYSVGDVFNGESIETPLMTGRIGNRTVTVPLSNTGLMYSGKGFSTRYITRQAFDETTDNLGFMERYVARLEQAGSSYSSSSGISSAFSNVDTELLDVLKTEESKAMSQAVWALPEEMSTAGSLAKNRLTQKQSVWAGSGNFTERNLESMLDEGRSVFPYGSPDTVAKGTMMTTDIAQDLYGPMGRLVSAEQRPTQHIREWGLSSAAKREADSIEGAFSGTFGEYYDRLDRKVQGPEYRNIMYGPGKNASSHSALSTPQLVSFYAKEDVISNGALGNMISEEEVMLSKKATNMMEYEKVVQKKIVLQEGAEINEALLKGMKGKKIGEVFKISNPLDQGQFLGLERGSGRELFSRTAHEHGVSEIIGAQLTDKNTLTVFQKEKYNFEGNFWGKLFSEDAKYMGRQRSDEEINNALKAAKVPMWKKNTIAGQEVEAVLSGKLVKKRHMALMTQQMEALSLFAGDKIDRGELRALDERFAKRFMNNPARKLGVHRLQSATNLAATELEIQKDMVSVAKRLNLNQEEMGLTFGLLDSSRASELGIEKAVEKSSGVVGLSKMALGDLASGGGAGGLGSMEATGFRAMAMQGQEGQMFAAELSTRMKGKTYLSSADKMNTSLLGIESLPDKAKNLMGKTPTDNLPIGQLSSKDLFKEEGRYVNLGTKVDAFNGASKIYIPGKNDDLVKKRLVDSGKLLESPVAKDLRLLQSAIKEGADPSDIEKIGSRLRNTVVAETESLASGKGKIIGSKLLTGKRQNAYASKAQAFGISPKAGGDMFDDLIKRAKSDREKTFLAEQKASFFKGDTLVGGSWRHPTTGPESFQFVKYRMDKGISNEMMSIPMRKEKLSIAGQASRVVDTSAMVGMKGDFDRDQFVIAAISNRDTQQRVAKNIDHSMAQKYDKYLFNNYAMKSMIDESKATRIPNVFLEGGYKKSLVAGMKDLTTAKVATPRVNIALQKLKLGLQHSAPKEYRPMADLFFHLEEAAISGKHGSLDSEIYRDIEHAVSNQDVDTMENVIRQVVGNEEKQITGSLRGQAHSFNYNPRQFAETAINAATAAGEDVEYAYKATRAAKGNLNRTEMNEMIAMHFKRKQGSIDILPSLRQAAEYGGEGFEQGANRFLRRAQTKGATFKKALRGAKTPALIGAAIAAGVMLSAPSISGSMAMPREGARGGRSLNRESIGPPQGLRMNPPTRIMSSPKVYEMTGIKTASRANIRMSMADADASSGAFMRHARLLAESGSTNIRTTDDRSVMNPQRLASKIHERL